MEPGSSTLEVARPEPPHEGSSLLFPSGTAPSETAEEQPEYFSDLNLDQFVAAVTADREEYELSRFFCAPLSDAVAVAYRQEVFLDLEDQSVLSCVAAFSESMRDVRAHLAQSEKLRHPYQAESWLLGAVSLYCDAVVTLVRGLSEVKLHSSALTHFHDYLASYIRDEAFASLVSRAHEVREALAEVHYCVNVKGGRVTVAKYDGEPNYSAEVLATFDRFKRGAAKDYRATFQEPVAMNHVEANVLSLVARLYLTEFALLAEFCGTHRDFIDPIVRRFDFEAQFYMAYLAHIAPLRAVGLNFCYPKVTRDSKKVCAQESFDIVLANKLTSEGTSVICNDFSLNGPERVMVVSGPNQGGKTTFARMFGQLHHLASIGCPVPGVGARLYLFEGLFTHFEREENLDNATGKLEDDLLRARRILSAATTDSVVVLNEPFLSTTLQDSLFLGTKVMERLVELDVLAVLVTFVEELSVFGRTTPSGLIK
jgi:DNA mismatch repair protein MutS